MKRDYTDGVTVAELIEKSELKKEASTVSALLATVVILLPISCIIYLFIHPLIPPEKENGIMLFLCFLIGVLLFMIPIWRISNCLRDKKGESAKTMISNLVAAHRLQSNLKHPTTGTIPDEYLPVRAVQLYDAIPLSTRQWFAVRDFINTELSERMKPVLPKAPLQVRIGSYLVAMAVLIRWADGLESIKIEEVKVGFGVLVFGVLVVFFTLLERILQWWHAAALDRQTKLKRLYKAVLFICDGYVLPQREE